MRESTAKFASNMILLHGESTFALGYHIKTGGCSRSLQIQNQAVCYTGRELKSEELLVFWGCHHSNTANSTWIAKGDLTLTQPTQKHRLVYCLLSWVCFVIWLPKATVTLHSHNNSIKHQVQLQASLSQHLFCRHPHLHSVPLSTHCWDKVCSSPVLLSAACWFCCYWIIQ